MAKADVADRDAFRAALKAADFPSVRGNFNFGNNQHPIQNFYAREVVKATTASSPTASSAPRSRTTPTPTPPNARCSDSRARDGPRRPRHPMHSQIGLHRFPYAAKPPFQPLPRSPPMTATLLIEQVLNGLQFGTMLFLMAAGLTLVFGVMGLINLAHGSLYMVGAFAAAAAAAATGIFLLALAAALAAAAARRRAGRDARPPPPLPPRPPRPGPRDLRPHPRLLRRHPLALRLLPALSRRSRSAFRHRPPRHPLLPALPPRDHRRRASPSPLGLSS